MFCSNCGKEIPNDMMFCPNCGSMSGQSENITNSRPTRGMGNILDNLKKKRIIVAGVAAIVVVLAVIFVVSGNNGAYPRKYEGTYLPINNEYEGYKWVIESEGVGYDSDGNTFSWYYDSSSKGLVFTNRGEIMYGTIVSRFPMKIELVDPDYSGDEKLILEKQ